MSWEYEVTEGDEVKRQHIELETKDGGVAWVLATRTGSRRAYYEVSTNAGCFYLHNVRYKLSYLPFSRTTRFEPPLPFLMTSAPDSANWSWRGQAKGMGRTLRSADYRAWVIHQPAAASSGELAPGDLIVEAAFLEDSGELHRQRAIYRPGIGLIRIEAPEYHKQLVRWKSAAESAWHAMARHE